jgi:hypothetical protein
MYGKRRFDAVKAVSTHLTTHPARLRASIEARSCGCVVLTHHDVPARGFKPSRPDRNRRHYSDSGVYAYRAAAGAGYPKPVLDTGRHRAEHG